MSKEFAFSEITPLREIDCSSARSTTRTIAVTNLQNSSITSDDEELNNNSHVISSYNTITNNNNNQNSNSNNSINSLNSAVNFIATSAIVQLESGLNYNYNEFDNRILHQNTTVTNNNNGSKREINIIMDINRKIITKIALDFVILLCVCLPILFFYLFGEPYKRGFFCDDESLKHPFHESTVKNYMLYMIGFILPLFIILPMEYFRGVTKSVATYRFMNFEIPSWIFESYKQVGVFIFGAGSQQLVVDIAKYSVGRLRPHFMDVCRPVMVNGTKCDDPINFERYIDEFKCTSDTSTDHMIKEMRLSFPSGHSSFSAFTMVYCIIYLQSRMNWRGSKLMKHFLQLLLLCITWFTALSRISDYKHHWSDVLAGGSIGIIFAIIVSRYVSNFNDIKFELPTISQEINKNLYTTTPVHQHYSNNHHQQQDLHQNSVNK